MPNLPVHLLPLALSGFIKAQIVQSVPSINAAFADDVLGFNPAPVVDTDVIVGDVPNPAAPRFCVDWNSSPPLSYFATGGINLMSLTYRIIFWMPGPVADSTPENYAAALQLAWGYTAEWMSDDRIALAPTISLRILPGASVGITQGMMGRTSPFYSRRLADGKTMARGWDVFYTLTVNVAYGVVLSS